MTHFNASAPPPEPQRDPLDAMQAETTRRNLDDALDRVAELSAELSEDDPIPPEVVAHCDRITGADDAPLAFASLHRRVAAGRTSWQSWWDDPSSEAEGMRLFQVVIEAVQDEANALIADPGGPEGNTGDSADGGPDGGPGRR